MRSSIKLRHKEVMGLLGEVGEKMNVIYRKWHNNYEPLKVGRTYEATQYKEGWLLIYTGGYEERALYREGCFERV